ncbi:MAG: hypothetical protein PHU80_10345 [Kiritimatiellae bacterium]|nr:hypothetical protein [Kiritimatiellia bacterium]
MTRTIGRICLLLSLASCGCLSGGSRVKVDGVRQLTFGSGNDTEAVWSPDGKRIAFTGFSDGDPAWGVYVIDPRCGDLIRLETGAGNSKSPCWSPDGGSIVFENNRTGAYKLYCAGLRVLDRPAARGFPNACAAGAAARTGAA